MTRNERLVGLAAVLLLAGITLAIGYRWGRGAAAPAAAAAVSSQTPVEPEVLYWYDPMMPDQHFDKPGKSPYMDMELVPKYAADAAPGDGIRIDPRVQQNLGVRTVVVGRGRLATSPRVPGTVGWNLREQRLLSLPVDAVVEGLAVRTPFEPVQAGQALLTIRAPEWTAALAEAQALRSARSPDAAALRGAAEGRLQALGLPPGARADGRGGIVITAPSSGVVSEIAVREGQAIPAGATLMRIDDPRTVWVEAALPTAVAADIAEGARVEVLPGGADASPLVGHVEALLPQIDADTRTRRARIALDNAGGDLSPGQYVQVLVAPDVAEALLVPSEAVIDDGVQTRVIALRGDRFVPVAVRTGRSAGGRTEVLSGLSPGERVVASGQFLIDSEANLTGALERLGKAPAAPASEHADHAP